MIKKQAQSQQNNLSKLKTIIRKYGGDTTVTNTSGTAVWLKKSGYSSLANLISHGKK